MLEDPSGGGNADLRLATWLPSRLAAKKFAFTLAEVLITLGIIGVVAALTLPTVIKHYKAKVLETAFKKVSQTFMLRCVKNYPLWLY